MQKLLINRIEKAFEWLEEEFATTDAIQSVDALIAQLKLLNASIPFAYNQMAVAKRELNAAKTKAYNSLAASSMAQDRYYAPSLAKDYINAKCESENYNYDLTERLCRAMVHVSDNLRTAISALKEEIKLETYTSQH